MRQQARRIMMRAVHFGASEASFAEGGVNHGLCRAGFDLGEEAEEQATAVAVLRSFGIPLIVSPGGAKMTPRVAAEASIMGLVSGIPDLLLPTHRKAIEFKAPSKRPKTNKSKSQFPVARPDQRAWLEQLSEAGWSCCVVFSAFDALRFISWSGIIPAPLPIISGMAVFRELAGFTGTPDENLPPVWGGAAQ